ncbi:MAG: hypothetical protein P8X89_12145 [Reinekea sp.]
MVGFNIEYAEGLVNDGEHVGRVVDCPMTRAGRLTQNKAAKEKAPIQDQGFSALNCSKLKSIE